MRPAIRPQDEGLLKALMGHWGKELCSEHDGSIADFEKLDITLDRLEDYVELLSTKRYNLARAGKIGVGVVACGAVFCPAAYFAAPSVASALGSAGLLGAASTGTAISSLSGAALTSASLAALGPGGMAGGAAVVTAVGGALGASKGAVVTNSYFGAVKDFKIAKVKKGSGPALIFVNGFLSQRYEEVDDWLTGVRNYFPRNASYHVSWEAKDKAKLGSLFAKGATTTALRVASRRANPLALADLLTSLIGNPWHSAMVKAAMTGIMLADILARTRYDDGFIVMGHSLGARVIYYMLKALSTKIESPIVDAYLLGGATDRSQRACWDDAAKAINGNLYNVYSQNDGILKGLYRTANAFISAPIGLGPIEADASNIRNFDASDLVSGHMEHKPALADILKKIHS
jgi:hypothetical protein